MQLVWGLHLDNHCSGDSAQSICLGWGVSPSIHKQHPCLLNLAEISGHLPNIYHLFFPSWTPVLLTTTYPGSRTLHLQTPFGCRCPHDLVSPMKCTWTHWMSLLEKSNKGGWSIVALSESSTNNSVYHKLSFLLPFLLSYNVGLMLEELQPSGDHRQQADARDPWTDKGAWVHDDIMGSHASSGVLPSIDLIMWEKESP